MNDAELLDEYQALQEDYHDLLTEVRGLKEKMSSFQCQDCDANIIDTPRGYITGCQHHPLKKAQDKETRNSMDIEDLISRFNFKKVYKIMVVLDWYWYGSEEIPTVENMKKTVRELYRSFKDDSVELSATGGFTLSKRTSEEGHNYLELEFIPAYADTEYPNG
jgi:hypothetical protein